MPKEGLLLPLLSLLGCQPRVHERCNLHMVGAQGGTKYLSATQVPIDIINNSWSINSDRAVDVLPRRVRVAVTSRTSRAESWRPWQVARARAASRGPSADLRPTARVSGPAGPTGSLRRPRPGHSSVTRHHRVGLSRRSLRRLRGRRPTGSLGWRGGCTRRRRRPVRSMPSMSRRAPRLGR